MASSPLPLSTLPESELPFSIETGDPPSPSTHWIREYQKKTQLLDDKNLQADERQRILETRFDLITKIKGLSHLTVTTFHEFLVAETLTDFNCKIRVHHSTPFEHVLDIDWRKHGKRMILFENGATAQQIEEYNSFDSSSAPSKERVAVKRGSVDVNVDDEPQKGKKIKSSSQRPSCFLVAKRE